MTDQTNSTPERSAAAWLLTGQQAMPAPAVPQSAASDLEQPQQSRFGVGVLIGIGIGLTMAAVGLLVVGLIVALAAPQQVGDNPLTDVLHGQCDEGNMAACDALYWEAAADSELAEFAGTCGGSMPWTPGGCGLLQPRK